MSEFVHSGRRLIANRKFQEAVKVCRLGLLKDPACLEGRLVLAQALMSLARYDEVLAEARAALELDPGSAEGTILLGEALFSRAPMHRPGTRSARPRSCHHRTRRSSAFCPSWRPRPRQA